MNRVVNSKLLGKRSRRSVFIFYFSQWNRDWNRTRREGGGEGGREGKFLGILRLYSSSRPFIKYPRDKYSFASSSREEILEKRMPLSLLPFSPLSHPSLFFFIPAAKTPTAFPSRLKTVISARWATARRDLDLISVDYRRLRAPVDKHERGIPVAPTSAPLFMLI